MGWEEAKGGREGRVPGLIEPLDDSRPRASFVCFLPLFVRLEPKLRELESLPKHRRSNANKR